MRDAPHPMIKNSSDGSAEIDGAVEDVREPLVLQEAEQVDVPLIGVGQAVEQDHNKREGVEVEQDRAARLLGKIFQAADEDEIAQQVEEPLGEIAYHS